MDQLQRPYVSPDDTEPGDTPRFSDSREENPSVSEQLPSDTSTATTEQPPTSENASPEYVSQQADRARLTRKSFHCCNKFTIPQLSLVKAI